MAFIITQDQIVKTFTYPKGCLREKMAVTV
jgi:hypothetical protein